MQRKKQEENAVLAALGLDEATKTTSITESNSLQEFISSAVLANRQFDSVRDVELVMEGTKAAKAVSDGYGPHAAGEAVAIDLPIPRRPHWDEKTTKAELDREEKLSFLEWRRGIAVAEGVHPSLKVTPFEKNLEFWRQLWRVVERSDVLIQVVDCRNPLTFRCKDLEKYVMETGTHKRTMLLLNKADFLTPEERLTWSQYFRARKVAHLFFSAKQEQAELDRLEKIAAGMELDEEEEAEAETGLDRTFLDDAPVPWSSRVVGRDELLTQLCAMAQECAERKTNKVRFGDSQTLLSTVGFTGYPNVGKSSVINVIKGVVTFSHDVQRVSVAATPGHTKHFQTVKLTEEVMMCDSPGLVFPSFFSSKAEMLCNGILPIDEIRGRDFVPAIEFMCNHVTRQTLESTYNLTLPMLPSVKMANPDFLLETYCRHRGLLGKAGRFDESRAARIILKDFVSGRLLYAHPPPAPAAKKAKKDVAPVADSADAPLPQIDEVSGVSPETAAADVVVGAEEESEDEEVLEFGDSEFAPVPVTNTSTINLDADVSGAASLDEAVEFAGKYGGLEGQHKPSRRLAKHGKKHKKARDKDPYGPKGMGLINTEGKVHMKKPY